ncbi:MAG: T9SS type A sorting domain-containing protein, partial [Bacteroidetes bacterium]|nr:T9SS type A sorting domain-containing protein [Bacteroidota bacterium]
GISGGGGTICQGSSVTLTATGGSLGSGANYQWGTGTTIGSNPIAGATSISYAPTPSSTTSYWVSVTGPSPCNGAGGTYTTVTVNTPSSAVTGISGGGGTICQGSGVTLTATGGSLGTGANYQWGTGSVIGTNPIGGATSASYTPTPSSTTTYWVSVSGPSPCNGAGGVTTTVNVNTPSTAPTGISGTTTLCSGNGTTLTATGGSLGTGANYQWGTGTVIGTNPIAGATSVSYSVTPASTTSYWVSVTGPSPCNGAGGVYTTVNVTTTPTPTFVTVPSSPTCTYTNVTYTTQSGYSGYTWSGFGTAGTDYNIVSGGLSATDYTVTLQWLSTGTKSLSINYSNGSCPAVTPGTNTTVVNASPSPTLSTSGAFCTSNSVVYTTQSGNSNYTWTIAGTAGVDYTLIAGGGTSDYSATIQWITTGSKTVSVNYTNGSGCTGPTAASTSNTVNNGPSGAAISDNIDPCNGGHTAYVVVTGGTSPYNFTVCGTAYTNQTSPFELDATSNTSCALSLVSDANGCTPGTISGSPVSYPTRTLTSGDTYACTVSTGATKIFYDHSGNLMVKITDGGATLGSTSVTTTVDGSVQQFGPTDPQSYLQRHFKISPSNTSGSAAVCLYLSDAEATALNTASHNNDNHNAPSYYSDFQTNLSNAVVTKFHGGAETPTNNTSRIVLTPTSMLHNPTVNGVTYNNVWEVCMNVSSWSGFYIHAQNVNNTPLPVTLLYLTADAINNKYIDLDWATASEINNKGFAIERSTDGREFAQVGWLDGHGNSNTQLSYSYSDRTVQPGVVYYYRLKQVDFDGQFVYSEIVSASLIGDKGFSFEDMIPNPAVNSVQLGILTTAGQKATVTITDMLGRVVLDQPWQLAEGYNISSFDISDLAQGTYSVTVYTGNSFTTKKLVVTK